MRGEYLQETKFGPVIMELPPRARRIRWRIIRPSGYTGTTSACAENTIHRPATPRARWNYLRVRGEYGVGACYNRVIRELPPRARRILYQPSTSRLSHRTTSACAENTAARHGILLPTWNYLRVRGEYSRLPGRCPPWWELPPRARRILRTRRSGLLRAGTTSACAENTGSEGRHWRRLRNYLRVRGEYSPHESAPCPPQELPPRARRIRWSIQYSPVAQGTTSACAENTPQTGGRSSNPGNYLRVRGEYIVHPHFKLNRAELPPRARRIPRRARRVTHIVWNYLRVRGEYVNCASRSLVSLELPPRARRIRMLKMPKVNKIGTTSACAENTIFAAKTPPTSWNYLRVRGEYHFHYNHTHAHTELPPRARRIQRRCDSAHKTLGTTSACAENTLG